VDEMYEKLPEILEDKYWDTYDIFIPYTKEAEEFHKPLFIGSIVDIPCVCIVVGKRRFRLIDMLGPSAC